MSCLGVNAKQISAIDWLIDGGYRYLVVSPERNRQFDPKQAFGLTTASG
ncbi:hypothetical protein [Methylicorpusculum sp.]|nr:hypothetical protein [Methylicorpusculum sp.]MDZ4149560.1 hypothetical protein [Methylicorpusculum sp.]